MTPVEALRDRPAGSAPAEMEYVGAGDPLAAKFPVKGVPTVSPVIGALEDHDGVEAAVLEVVEPGVELVVELEVELDVELEVELVVELDVELVVEVVDEGTVVDVVVVVVVVVDVVVVEVDVVVADTAPEVMMGNVG